MGIECLAKIPFANKNKDIGDCVAERLDTYYTDDYYKIHGEEPVS